MLESTSHFNSLSPAGTTHCCQYAVTSGCSTATSERFTASSETFVDSQLRLNFTIDLAAFSGTSHPLETFTRSTVNHVIPLIDTSVGSSASSSRSVASKRLRACITSPRQSPHFTPTSQAFKLRVIASSTARERPFHRITSHRPSPPVSLHQTR